MYKLPKFGSQISVKVHVSLKDDPVWAEWAGKESVQLDLKDEEKLGRKEMYPRATDKYKDKYLLPITDCLYQQLLIKDYCFPSVNSILHRYSTAQGMKLQRNTMTAITPEPGMPPLEDLFLSLVSGIR